LLPATTGFLLSISFEHEDGSEIFLWNIRLSLNYMIVTSQKFVVPSIITAVRNSDPA
jgi:hypothetical protein